MTPSTDGLLLDKFLTAGLDRTAIQILESNVVCLSQGLQRDEYTSISVLVRYMRELDNMTLDAQVEFICTRGIWESGIATTVRSDPIVTLTSETRRDCTLCLPPGAVDSLTADDYHCIGGLCV
jgi:hypothetical protein